MVCEARLNTWSQNFMITELYGRAKLCLWAATARSGCAEYASYIKYALRMTGFSRHDSMEWLAANQMTGHDQMHDHVVFMAWLSIMSSWPQRPASSNFRTEMTDMLWHDKLVPFLPNSNVFKGSNLPGKRRNAANTHCLGFWLMKKVELLLALCLNASSRTS